MNEFICCFQILVKLYLVLYVAFSFWTSCMLLLDYGRDVCYFQLMVELYSSSLFSRHLCHTFGRLIYNWIFSSWSLFQTHIVTFWTLELYSHFPKFVTSGCSCSDLPSSHTFGRFGLEQSHYQKFRLEFTEQSHYQKPRLDFTEQSHYHTLRLKFTEQYNIKHLGSDLSSIHIIQCLGSYLPSFGEFPPYQACFFKYSCVITSCYSCFWGIFHYTGIFPYFLYKIQLNRASYFCSIFHDMGFLLNLVEQPSRWANMVNDM